MAFCARTLLPAASRGGEITAMPKRRGDGHAIQKRAREIDVSQQLVLDDGLRLAEAVVNGAKAVDKWIVRVVQRHTRREVAS